MITPGGLLVPDPREPGITHTLTGAGAISRDEGMHGHLIVRKGTPKVHLPVTEKQFEVLSQMGIEEWT